MKHESVTLGQVEAAFDEYGRRISKGLHVKVCNAKRDFRLGQPQLDKEVNFAKRIVRLHECLDIDTKVTAEQLKTETERLLAIIRRNFQIANIAKGVYLPIVLPKLVTGDLGAELELYLAGVNNSHAKTFSNREFYNHCKGILANQVRVVDGSRHDRLIERMKQGPVIGLHFPNPLQGFSIKADREQMPMLSEGLVLSGMDTPITMVMYLDILARNWDFSGLDMAALQWQSADYSLLFEACDRDLSFGRTSILTAAGDCSSGGLLFLG